MVGKSDRDLVFHLMNLSTRLVGLPRTSTFMSPTPPNRPPRSPTPSVLGQNDAPALDGSFQCVRRPRKPYTRNGRPKAKRPVRHRFTPIRLKPTFEALRREGVDFTDLQSALAGHVCATTRTLNAVHVRRPGKSERLHPTGNAPPSHHSSVTLDFDAREKKHQTTNYHGGFTAKYRIRPVLYAEFKRVCLTER